MKSMTRSKNQALYKFLPEMWVSEGAESGTALTAKIDYWNYRKMENIYKSFIQGEIKRQVKSFGDKNGDITSYDLEAVDFFEIVEPNCSEGVPDVFGSISPLFFYCSRCGYSFMKRDSREIPQGIWKCPKCHEGHVKQLQMIYTCECGNAIPVRTPSVEGVKDLRYRPNEDPYALYYKIGNAEKKAQLLITCQTCGNILKPDNIISGRNYKPFSVKMINLVDSNSGKFYEKGAKAYKTIVSRWFDKIGESGYYKILSDVDYSFDTRNSVDSKRKEVEDQVQKLVTAGMVNPANFENFVTTMLSENGYSDRESVDSCVSCCDSLFTSKKSEDEMLYNSWLESFSFKLMQYYTIKDSKKKIALSDSIDRQIALGLIDTPEEIPAMNRKLGIRNMLVSNDTQIITCTYGYTRRTEDPKNNKNNKCRLKLNAYTKDREGRTLVYGAKLDTEGILFEIDQKKIIRWLFSNEIIDMSQMPDIDNDECVKVWYAENVYSESISPFAEVDGDLITQAVFGLMHSMSHAFIKAAGEISGLSSNSLSEIIFVETSSIFIYAQTSQGIPLGALSGMAECRYFQFLKNVFNDSRSCIFDPLCEDRDDSVCSGCLIISDTSCNNFNKMLGRKYLYSLKKVDFIHKGFWEMD